MIDTASISLKNQNAIFGPGESLEGQAAWRLSRAPKSIEIHLLWHTMGRGTEDVHIVESEVVATPQLIGEKAIRYQLPDVPYSFSGKLISLIWSIEIVINQGEIHHRKDFVLSPFGAEVDIRQLSTGV